MLLRHPESVAIVVLDGDELVLVRQKRPGAPEPTLELPSGKLEPGESPAQAVVRELAEECGLAAASRAAVGSFWAVPAYSTEFVHVWEATDLDQSERGRPDPDENLEIVRLDVGASLAELSDAVSIAALALWRARA